MTVVPLPRFAAKLVCDLLEAVGVDRRQAYRRVYLRSWGWRGYSRRVRRASGGRCGCGCRKVGDWRAMHAHHATYARLGRERPGDVVAVLAAHHARMDARRKRGRK